MTHGVTIAAMFIGLMIIRNALKMNKGNWRRNGDILVGGFMVSLGILAIVLS